jgi:hypothetical protein
MLKQVQHDNKNNYALLAQLVEQLPFKEKVTGSNPVQRTRGLKIRLLKKPEGGFINGPGDF